MGGPASVTTPADLARLEQLCKEYLPALCRGYQEGFSEGVKDGRSAAFDMAVENAARFRCSDVLDQKLLASVQRCASPADVRHAVQETPVFEGVAFFLGAATSAALFGIVKFINEWR